MINIHDLIAINRPIKVVDVGAMSLGDGVTPPYHPLVTRGIAEIIGFEPVQHECDKLNSRAKSHEKYLPYFIGDGSRRTFHLCNYSMTSSLYEPNTPLLDRFVNLENLVRVVNKSSVETRRLDEIAEATNAEFLKIDVQGAELDVFKGATNLLDDVLVIHTEVEFLPLYKQQPLFADVDAYLREHGFLLHKFADVCGRMFKPLADTKNPNTWVNQPLWADVVYVKSFMDMERLTDEQLLRLTTILHDVYGSVDLCAALLSHYDSRTGNDLSEKYIQKLIAAGPT